MMWRARGAFLAPLYSRHLHVNAQPTDRTKILIGVVVYSLQWWIILYILVLAVGWSFTS